VHILIKRLPVIDNAYCGGPDDSNGYTDSSPAIDSAALGAIAAVIEMGSPRFVGGLDYGVGTCTTGGFSARPSGYTCAVSFASISILLVSFRVWILADTEEE
jgi:acetylxylan esterase